MGLLNLTTNPLYQSPYTYLQAAGSDGSDGSAIGIHLRWTFRNALGDNHLAKGNLSGSTGPFPSAIGFNQNNDFVKIYRVPYTRPVLVTIRFRNNIQPTTETKTGALRQWVYSGNNPVPQASTNSTDVIVRFTDIGQYDALRATMPVLRPEDFMKQYTGIIEVGATQGTNVAEAGTTPKLLFAFDFTVAFTNPRTRNTGYIRVEAISLDDTSDPSTTFVSCRQKFMGTEQRDAFDVTCENIRYFRFDRSNAYPTQITLETYVDFILFNNVGKAGNWVHVGDYSLITTDSEAYLRLEDTVNYPIDKKWPKYNEYNQTTGAFTVSVPNYRDRWIPAVNPANGLKQAVTQFLSSSETDLKANVLLTAQSSDPNDHSVTTVSYLDMLNLVGLDFHVARMLGLGTIDPVHPFPFPLPPFLLDLLAIHPGSNRQFVYCLQYYTTANLADASPKGTPVMHTYMSLPTSELDFRLPPTPVSNPITYGLFADNGTLTPTELSGPGGYSRFSDVRFININRAPFVYEKPFSTFFSDQLIYCLCEETLPIFFGLEYKAASETVYRIPELSNDPNYSDHAGIQEVIPIPDQNQNPVYIHQEKEPGIHNYALYSINWFSRISPDSNVVSTDTTVFTKRKTLLPPFNFGVQLIQEENPLIFTTQAEQTLLQNYTAADKTFVRAVFDWNHVHFNAYQFANHAELFFRRNLANEVKGRILSVIPLTGHLIQVTTQSYTVTSTNPAQIVQPSISGADVTRYAGGLFSANGKNYVIDSVQSLAPGGVNPVFILEQIRQTNSSDPTLSNQFTNTETFVSPQTGEQFFTSENLSNDKNWDADLTRKIYLERFNTNSHISISNSTGNNGIYTLEQVQLIGGLTDIYVLEKIKNAIPNGVIHYEHVFSIFAVSNSPNSFTISGNWLSELIGATSLKVFGSQKNDLTYTISSVSLIGGNTQIRVTSNIPDLINFQGYVSYLKSVHIVAVDQVNKKFSVTSNITAELIAPYIEYTTESDGSLSRLIPGGIFQPTTIVERPNVYGFGDPGVNSPPPPPTPPPHPGDPIPNSRTGIYEITFNNSYQLAPHISPDVDWYKGTVRISEDPTYTAGATPKMKTLQVWSIENRNPLKLIAVDATLDVIRTGNQDIPNPNGTFVPIRTGGHVNVNFHPSYKTYLKADTNPNLITGGTNNFDHLDIFPLQGEGNRKTIMAIRSIDTSDHIVNPSNPVLDSFMSVPVVLLAQEIIDPVAPDMPNGPLYATRPDFYGKATYTFDMKVDTMGGRQPFALVLYRANEDKILDILYKPSTVQLIKAYLAGLPNPDAGFFNNRFSDLVNVQFETALGPNNGLFKAYIPGGYRFPNPDNNTYIIPDRNTFIIERPFDLNGLRKPGDSYTYVTNPSITRTMSDIILEAINLNFLSLTEQPLIFKYIGNGKTTSNRKPRYKSVNGDPLLPTDPNFDPSPMAVQYTDGNGTHVRFTDYTLDGASKNIYFYYGIELSNRMQFGPRSPIAGPIQLVNTNAATPPEIRRVLSQLPDSVSRIPAAVKFELNNYIPGENIKKLQIYRISDPQAALSVRTMKLAKTVSIGSDVLDDFSDVAFPLYGDPLFYRIVALRQIVNEQSQIEYVPSNPSNLVLASIVDNVNPSPPKISFSSDPPTTAAPVTLNNVILTWATTCYNGTYFLSKMDRSGNWVKVYQVKSNAPTLSVSLINTDIANGSVVKQDSSGNTIYERFRVQVLNSSGLLNLIQNELTI
jgi:hypothetical protein